MGYIYKITNLINGTSYIGQTVRSIEIRYTDHWNSALNGRGKSKEKDESNFPLHLAMKKYGKENFKIECIEECPNEQLNEREIYYIKKYDTYNNGYNASLGGDGHQKYDYDEIVNFFLQSNNELDTTCKHFNIYDQVVYNALQSKGIDYKNLPKRTGGKPIKKRILMVEENKIFNNMSEIDKYFGKTVHPNIRRCLKGITKKAYGYHWKELDE